MQAQADDKIAKAQAEKDAKARAAELEKNIADLKKIGAASAPTAPAVAAAPVTKASGMAAPVSIAAAPAAAPASAPAPAPAVAASAPAETASAPVQKPVLNTRCRPRYQLKKPASLTS